MVTAIAGGTAVIGRLMVRSWPRRACCQADMHEGGAENLLSVNVVVKPAEQAGCLQSRRM